MRITLVILITLLGLVSASAEPWGHGGGHGWHGNGGGFGGWRPGWHQNNDFGSNILGGIIGGAIGGWLTRPDPPPVVVVPPPAPPMQEEIPETLPWTPAWYDYCGAKYNSFDAKTGFYMGFDGVRHFCR